MAIERLSDEAIRERFSKASLCDKLIPKLCKEACKNPEASVKIQALYILSLLSVGICRLVVIHSHSYSHSISFFFPLFYYRGLQAHMNEEYVATNILPSLKFITDNEKNASVSMCVVGKKNGVWFVCMYVL